MIAAQFLRNPVTAIPYTIHIILTDNGIQFTNIAHHKYAFHHIFDRICDENGIEHRPTKARHSWTNEQVERMNRTIKEATVKRYHYDSHDQFRQHLSGSTSATSWLPRISAAGSKPSGASPRTRPSAKHGKTSQIALHQTRTIKCRDQTPRRFDRPRWWGMDERSAQVRVAARPPAVSGWMRAF